MDIKELIGTSGKPACRFVFFLECHFFMFCFSGVGTVQEECSQDLAGPGAGDVTRAPRVRLSNNMDAFCNIYSFNFLSISELCKKWSKIKYFTLRKV